MKQTALALSLATLAFILTVIWGPPLLRVLRHFRIGKLIRVEEPAHHFVKMGTPTMGGVLFILPTLFLTGLLNAVSLIGIYQNITGRSVLLPMLVMVSYGLLGALDDWEGIRGPRRGQGMRARTKFLFQVFLAAFIAYALYEMLKVPQLFLPGVKGKIELGWWYIPIAMFIIVGTSNAFPVVQRAPGAVNHGRYRFPGAGRDAWHGGADDRALGPPAADRRDPAGGGAERDHPGRLFQADAWPSFLQNGADPSAF
jgi:UDP-N-acetylmuramyl pentapeptide phosphotransferase/UDP-N-acetylglucosamine-1-phosphate transferase